MTDSGPAILGVWCHPAGIRLVMWGCGTHCTGTPVPPTWRPAAASGPPGRPDLQSVMSRSTAPWLQLPSTMVSESGAGPLRLDQLLVLDQGCANNLWATMASEIGPSDFWPVADGWIFLVTHHIGQYKGKIYYGIWRKHCVFEAPQFLAPYSNDY